MLTCIYFLCKRLKYNNKKIKEFIVYLETKGDYDSLYKIGVYNQYGHKESRRAPGGWRALQKKYEETNDIKYKEYVDFAFSSLWRFFILCFGAFIGLAISWLIISNFGLPHTW